MDIKLRNDMQITYDMVNDDFGYRTLILKKGDTIPAEPVTSELAKEYTIFKPYVGKYYVDLSKLLPDAFVDEIDQIIIEDIK